jgi:hypothetical protein
MSRGGWRVVALVGALGCAYPGLEPDGLNRGDAGAGAPGASPGDAAGRAGPEPTETMNCGQQRIELAPQPADLVLVLDRSGSMLQNLRDRQSGRFVQKWAEVVGALDAVIDSTEGGVAWGLKLYPHGDTCAVPEGLTVPVALANHAAIVAAMRSSPALEGSGSTPAQDALRKAGMALRNRQSAGSKYLLLATDGLATCRPGGGAADGDRDGVLAAVDELRASGIPVFVLGIAIEGSEAHASLNEIALRGGRARADATRYYRVGSRVDLLAALEAITGQIYACTLRLDQAPPVPDNITIELDGRRLWRDPEHRDGWDYGDDTRSVLLFGPACAQLEQAAARKVQVLFGCP